MTGADVAAAAEADAAAPPSGGPLTASLDPLEIMRANLCLGCHVLDGEGVATGPPFDGMGDRIDADRIRRSILDPSAEAAEGYEEQLGTMTPTIVDLLTARQLEVLVQFLAGQRG